MEQYLKFSILIASLRQYFIISEANKLTTMTCHSTRFTLIVYFWRVFIFSHSVYSSIILYRTVFHQFIQFSLGTFCVLIRFNGIIFFCRPTKRNVRKPFVLSTCRLWSYDLMDNIEYESWIRHDSTFRYKEIYIA